MRSLFTSSMLGAWAVLLCCFTLVLQVKATPAPASTQWIQYTDLQGDTVYLDDLRRPALYTQAYGDCQGGSLLTLDRFYAAFYKDNATVMFHFSGSTPLSNQSTMIYMSVYAYGENRFNLTWNPCLTSITSMCPLNSSNPIEAGGIIPLSPQEVAGFPDIALTIPDFEGQAIIRIFSNATESQIACYSAVLSNGASFSHPAAVGSTVGVFVVVALISSMAVAVYGQVLTETRIHYAHSLSMFVIFSVLQHVFFTGALSMNFPSVVVAFWSNFGWASGMIYSKSMQSSINSFVGKYHGDISLVGSVASGKTAPDVGGGYSISQLYKRDTQSEISQVLNNLYARDGGFAHETPGYPWYGNLVRPGLPLPGNFSGFPGTLAELNIPASNAFLTGFIWFLVLVALIVLGVLLLKLAVEGLASKNFANSEHLKFFRTHWIYVMGIAVFRACYIAFFMMMFLTLFQFTFGGGPGPLAIAAIIFVLFLVGMLGVSAFALWDRLKSQTFHRETDRLQLKRASSQFIPWYNFTRESTAKKNEDARPALLSLPWIHLYFTDPAERLHVHEDESYLIRFGWLFARFRRSKWWFFSAWLVYEFVRACFYGGAAGRPLTQVFGLLVWEILSLVAIVAMKPFESNRLNLVMVYLLGFSKVVTVALSSAFDPRFGLDRIMTTVIGVIIIVIQALLVICLLIAIVVGAISSYMSIRRYHEEFSPKSLVQPRIKYFVHIEQKATDKPAPRPPTPEPVPSESTESKISEKKIKKPILSKISKEFKAPEPDVPTTPCFNVASVRRELKIEDEDPNHEGDPVDDDVTIAVDNGKDGGSRVPSRAGSVASNRSSLPYGARRHRTSWSARDLSTFNSNEALSGRISRKSIDSLGAEASTSRPSRSNTFADHLSSATVAHSTSNSGRLSKSRHYRSMSNISGKARNESDPRECDENAIQPAPPTS